MFAAQMAAMESAIADAESARSEALREMEVLRSKAGSHEEALERARQLESGHRKAMEDLAAAESALQAARLAQEEAGTGSAGLLEEAERQLSEVRSLESAAREAATKALEEGQAATELTTRLHGELKEARAAAEEARAAVASEKERSEQLVRELDEARGRILAMESSPSVPQPAADAPQENPVETVSREAWEKALEEGRHVNELNASLRRELEEVSAARQEASAAVASEQTRATQLAVDLEEAHARIASLEAAGPIPPEAPDAGIPQAQLDEARRAAEAVREELKAAQEEIRRLKAELSSPKPRPILTSQRPEGGAPARQP
jgi:hypothetical protein